MGKEFIKKKSVFLLLFLAIIIFLGIFLVLFLELGQKKSALPLEEAKSNNNEVNKLKENNKEIIEQARRVVPGVVPAINKNDHFFGDISAPIQLIIYDDFECPFCARFNDTVGEIKNYFKDKVVVIFRHYPLRSHPNALPAALASECAHEQGKFWEMHDKIFLANKEGKLSLDQYQSDAKDLELDIAQFNQCLETEKYKDKIQAQWLEGKNAGVSGTPGNFVNGESVPGAYPFEDFKDQGGNIQEGMKSIIERHLGNL